MERGAEREAARLRRGVHEPVSQVAASGDEPKPPLLIRSQRLGYKPDVHIDEFQAYSLTEPPNFFGTDLSDALDALRPLRPER